MIISCKIHITDAIEAKANIRDAQVDNDDHHDELILPYKGV